MQETAVQQPKKPLYAEVLGWYGMCALIGAYALTSFNVISSQSMTYQMLNLTGSLGLLVISLAARIYQNAILNIFWAAIGIFTIARLLLGS